MSTIQENLQIIAGSTSAIKQAIIDKGGDVTGDITTWADAISGISGGGSSEPEYVFTGTLSYSGSTVTITGSLNKIPDTGRNYLLVLGVHPVMPSMLCYANHFIYNTDPYTLSVDFEESETIVPAICILNIVGFTHTVIPVTFIQQTPIKFYLNDIEYDALYPMTWEQFVNSETYNPMLTDVNGYKYKMFSIKDGIVYSWILYDGECDIEQYVHTGNYSPTEKSTDIIKENTQYICN